MPTMKNGKPMGGTWHIRVPAPLDELLNSFVTRGTHTKAEFIREAVRAKLQAEFEHLEQIKRIQSQEAQPEPE